MGKKMIEEIKELLQSFLAPQLEAIRGDIRALDAKVDKVASSRPFRQTFCGSNRKSIFP
jgi:hypothetical protein